MSLTTSFNRSKVAPIYKIQNLSVNNLITALKEKEQKKKDEVLKNNCFLNNKLSTQNHLLTNEIFLITNLSSATQVIFFFIN